MENTSLAVIQKMDNLVEKIQGVSLLKGFEKAFRMSEFVLELRKELKSNDDLMNKVLSLQGSALGFKTDIIYSKDDLIDPIIEAMFHGATITGNEFNIISKRCYLAKDFFKRVLGEYEGLQYEFTFPVPIMNPDGGSATQSVLIEWSIDNREKQSKKLQFSIKLNKGMGADAVLGKAERKAGAWLLSKLKNTIYPEGEFEQNPFYAEQPKTNSIDIMSKISEANKKENC